MESGTRGVKFLTRTLYHQWNENPNKGPVAETNFRCNIELPKWKLFANFESNCCKFDPLSKLIV